MHKNKIAVIGIGTFGELHARTLNTLAEAELVALVDHDKKKLSRLAAELKVSKTFSNVEDLIKKNLVDAVVIATRTNTHLPIATSALKAGLHVLIEKPVGASLAEVKKLEKLAKNSKGIAMAGHICLFNSLTPPLLARVDKEGFWAAHFVRHRPTKLREIFPEEHPFRMTTIHDLYILGQMVDNEEPVTIEGIHAKGKNKHLDFSWATLRWKDGRVATLHSHWCLPKSSPADGWDTIEVFGTNYHAKIDTNPQPFIWNTEKTTWPLNLQISEIDHRPVGMLAEQLRSFIAACNGSPIPKGCRMQDAAQVQHWVDQLIHSATKK